MCWLVWFFFLGGVWSGRGVAEGTVGSACSEHTVSPSFILTVGMSEIILFLLHPNTPNFQRGWSLNLDPELNFANSL